MLTVAGVIVAEPAPVAVDTFSWTGGYIGINAGYAGGKFKHPFSDIEQDGGPRFSGSLDVTASGFVGGVQAGYNWQLANGLVLGGEADFQGSTVKSKLVGNGNLSDIGVAGNLSGDESSVLETKVQWFGTVRARLGFTPTERLMVYGTGGLAYGKVKTQLSAYGDGEFSAGNSKTKAGWTLGAGVEYAVTNNWTLKSEYLYTDLGKRSFNYIDEENVNINMENKVNFHTVRLGLNYKF
ncbi:outer membrane protein [Brucella abortus]|uniref:outer membrane protein n=1 Tax=Brucella abortus TaxID=235 RepID=UPI001FFC8427|nr:outer membrane protein [Brucella abortus]